MPIDCQSKGFQGTVKHNLCRVALVYKIEVYKCSNIEVILNPPPTHTSASVAMFHLA